MLNKKETLKLVQSVLISYNKEILNKLYILKMNSLEKNNDIEFIPLNDYNPATKKYVDNQIVSAKNELNNTLSYNMNSMLLTTKLSQFINDIDYATKEYVNSKISNNTGNISIDFDLVTGNLNISSSTSNNIIYDSETKNLSIL